MADEVSIRRAGLSDAALIQDLSKKTFCETFAGVNSPEDMEKYNEEHFSLEEVTRELACKESYFFIAFVGKRAAAYMKLNRASAQTEDMGPSSMELQRIYVLSEFKGRHIGSKLIKLAESQAVDLSLSNLWLGVWEHNDKALAFYDKMGFVRFSEHIFVLGQDRQTDFLLKKDLTCPLSSNL